MDEAIKRGRGRPKLVLSDAEIAQRKKERDKENYAKHKEYQQQYRENRKNDPKLKAKFYTQVSQCIMRRYRTDEEFRNEWNRRRRERRKQLRDEREAKLCEVSDDIGDKRHPTS